MTAKEARIISQQNDLSISGSLINRVVADIERRARVGYYNMATTSYVFTNKEVEQLRGMGYSVKCSEDDLGRYPDIWIISW